MFISASIVTYNTSITSLRDLIDSLLQSAIDRLYIIDNSEKSVLSSHLLHSKIIFMHKPSNPGFGASHNSALNHAIKSGFQFHFVINPDINLDSVVIGKMVESIQNDNSIGMLMPRIDYPNGEIQYLPKLLPTPLSLFLRKFKFPKFLHKKFLERYELRFVDDRISYTCPILSGCFILVRLKAILVAGYFDDSFFMYFEDWDLSRRISRNYRCVYNPDFRVIHEYNSGANKSVKLFFIFLRSAIVYFNKWGWFFDKERKNINYITLNQFNKLFSH